MKSAAQTALGVSVALVLPALGTGCSCDAIGVPAVTVTILDVTGHQVCDAAVVWHTGDQTFGFEAIGLKPQCSYAGAYEQSGTIEIEATARGEVGKRVVHVGRGRCHVKTKIVSIRLTNTRSSTPG